MRQVENPPNPYDKYSSEYLGEPPQTKLEIFEETATKSMIVKSWSPDLGRRFVVNCYRGCVHACTYCFARQYHEMIGYGAGTDFETKLVAKVNAPEVLRNELKKTRQKIPYLEFSFASDPYVPIEANYELTRRCLEVCREFRIPVFVLTKSPLVTRDLDILKELDCTVGFSIPFLSVETSRPFEPYVPTPEARFRAMEKVAVEGIDVALALAPVIPGYNDNEIPQILKKAKDCGATRTFMSLVHFATESVEEYFLKRLYEKLPTHADKIVNRLKEEKGGSLRHRSMAERNNGRTDRWKMIKDVFDLHTRKLGFEMYERIEKPAQEPVQIQQRLFS
ncbi:MAG: radical SAM protein [Acidobacteriota bacterium]|nr:MAG: radical SAM protein [Acidobacteriota bacterium]